MGGDAVRIIEHSRRRDGVTATAAGAVVMERVVGSAGTLVLMAVGLAVAAGRYDDVRFLIVLELAFVAAMVVLGLLLFSRRLGLALERRLFPLGRKVRLEKPLQSLYWAMHEYRTTPVALLAVLGVTLVSQLLRVIAIWLCGEAVGADVSPVVYIILGPLLFLVQMIPFTLNGLGVREAFFVLFLGRFDVPAGRRVRRRVPLLRRLHRHVPSRRLHPSLEERPPVRPGAAVKVVFLTTSYPRGADDFAGRFAAELADRLRGRGVDVDVVAPGTFRDYGLAYGAGMVANVRRRPWALPPMLGSMARAVHRAAAGADLVHAFWLPNAAVALAARKPVVVTLPGTDMELARRAPKPAGWVLRRVRVALPVAEAFAEQARQLGARDVRVVPTGLDLPSEPGEPADPPEVLYAGRLSEEKGVEELAAAADGLNLVVAGDGQLRRLFPQALGMVPRAELFALMERASIVVCPSRRDGLPVVCAEAMAHARPVVASAVGGLPDMVRDGETGLLVPPRDPAALRGAVDRLLADPELRRRLGAAARERIAELCNWDGVLDRTLEAYEDALR